MLDNIKIYQTCTENDPAYMYIVLIKIFSYFTKESSHLSSFIKVHEQPEESFKFLTQCFCNKENNWEAYLICKNLTVKIHLLLSHTKSIKFFS